MIITKELWAECPKGTVYRYTMKNSSGAFVELGSIGAGIISIVVPDSEGNLRDVALGFPDALSYLSPNDSCAGKIPGRYANRIFGAKFTLDGVEYHLPANKGIHSLHGGPEGFQNQVWDSRIDGEAVEFMYFSKDGEAGYPGNLKVVARYEWSEQNELRLTITAETDAPTVLNLTNHVYFNLNGEGNGDILDHVLQLNCSEYLPNSEAQIPIGESEPVAGTPMDFVNPKKIGRDIKADFGQLKIGKGYDNTWLIDGAQQGQLQSAAKLYSEQSGIALEVTTTQPAIQLYTGNWLSGSPIAKSGKPYEDYTGVALECQHLPDSPNKPDYPSTVLRPGETYEQAIIFAFSVR